MANSPDLNTLNLAFFKQSMCCSTKKAAANYDELIVHMKEAYNKLPWNVCIRVWTTAHMVMNKIICDSDNNKYKFPHANKSIIICKLGIEIPHWLPCQALINGRLVDGDVISELVQAQAEAANDQAESVGELSYLLHQCFVH